MGEKLYWDKLQNTLANFQNFPRKHPIPLSRRGLLLSSTIPNKATIIATRQPSSYFTIFSCYFFQFENHIFHSSSEAL